MTTPSEIVMLFVKHPEPGRVKTRLAPLFGERAAARVYRRLAARTAEAARRSSGGGRALHVHVEPADRVCDAPAWLGPAAAFHPQAPGALGARMAAAFETAFGTGAQRVVIVGSDVPGLEARDLDAAFAALATHDAALGPAADGGYWLLGLTAPRPSLFEGVPWSTGGVLEGTRERLREAKLSWTELRTLRDLDTPGDYLELASELPLHDADPWSRRDA